MSGLGRLSSPGRGWSLELAWEGMLLTLPVSLHWRVSGLQHFGDRLVSFELFLLGALECLVFWWQEGLW